MSSGYNRIHYSFLFNSTYFSINGHKVLSWLNNPLHHYYIVICYWTCSCHGYSWNTALFSNIQSINYISTPPSLLIFYFFVSASLARNVTRLQNVTKCNPVSDQLEHILLKLSRIAIYCPRSPNYHFKVFCVICDLFWKNYFKRHVNEYLLCDWTIDNSDINAIKTFIVVWLLPS